MKRLESIENKLVPITFTGLLLILWLIATEGGHIPKYVLPSPRDIVLVLFDIIPELKAHILVTLKEAFIGFGISIIFSLLLAILMDNVAIIKKALYPLILVSQTIPTIALAPLFVIWFGFGILPKIIVVVLVCFFPIVVSLLDGLSSVDNDLLNLLKSMGANRIQIFRLVKLPGAMTNFFSGLKIAATYSIMGAVIGEWLGGKAGLGIYMIRVKNSFALDKMFAVILIIVVLSMLVFKMISILEYLLMPWNRNLK